MEFVSFDLAKKLKEKGFPQHWSDHHYILENEYEDDFFEVGAKYPVEVIYDYIPTIAAPTISQVLKWLRDIKTISIEPCATPHNCWYYMIKCKGEIKATYMNNKYKTYEQAALAGIEYVLDNLI